MIKHTKKEILKIIKSYPCLEFFLKKHKVYTKYIKYSMNPKWAVNVDYINKPIDKHVKKYIVGFSFLFSQTNEGFDFWEKLNVLYSKIYDEYI